MYSPYCLVLLVFLLFSKIQAQNNESKIVKEDFVVKGVSPTNVTVSWSAEKLKAKGVRQLILGYISLESKGKPLMLSSSVEAELINIESLSPFTEYRLTMREGSEKNPPIGLGIVKTWPIAPIIKDMAARALSYSEIEVSWSIDTSKSGKLNLYLVRCLDKHGIGVQSVDLDNKSTSFIAEPLLPNTTYYCELIAGAEPARGQKPDDCKASAKSNPVLTPFHFMDAPEIEKFNEIDAHTLEIIMKEPVYWRGEFLGFSIEMRENPLELNPPWNFALSRAKNRLTYLVEELKSNTRYEFRVRGNVAPYGFSDYSKVYVFHTLNENGTMTTSRGSTMSAVTTGCLLAAMATLLV